LVKKFLKNMKKLKTGNLLTLLSLPQYAVISILVTSLSFRFFPEKAPVVNKVYYSITGIVILISFIKIFIINSYHNRINPKEQQEIIYNKEAPKGIIDNFFYKFFEVLNNEATKSKEERSVYSTGKAGLFMAFNFIIRVVIFGAFAVIYFRNDEFTTFNDDIFILITTVLCVSLLELIANTINTFLYWRTVYASGKDRVISEQTLEEKLEDLEKEIEAIKEKIKDQA